MISRARVRSLGVLALVSLAFALPSLADVADSAENGFTLRETATLSVPPARAYAAMLEVAKWWASDHTYSGDAANLSLEAKAGGCWCERLPAGGGVQHMTVVFLLPGKQARLTGGLGPLQSMGVAGSMDWKFDPAEKGTRVELRYAVGGYSGVGGTFKEIAPGVDSVLRAQFERYKRYAETGKP
jgi:Polyketide cyclase / dehydrase and lipid transport